MKNNFTFYTLGGLSLLFIATAIYFHNGYFDLVNDYIYRDSTIPAEFIQDKLYFMNKKLALKNRTIYGLFVLSLIVYFYNRKITHKWLKLLLFIQFLIVTTALFLWIVRPKGFMIY